MKIGEFAKKHNVTIDTVRHYISEGLLTPLRENTQYYFSDIDSDVMDTILLLKNMNFKLEDMKAYLLFQSIYTHNSFRYLGSFQEQFEKKLEENKAEIGRLKKINKLIEQRIAEYKFEEISFSRGLSLSFLPQLRCADCRENLELLNPDLLHNEIMSGELVCPGCGRHYYVKYGILSDSPVEDIEYDRDATKRMAEHYIENNDKNYVRVTREFFQKMSEITTENSADAKNVLIDGEACGFLNSAIIRSIPKESRLFVHCRQSLNIKVFCEDIFPKETIVYLGTLEKAPFDTSMDYIMWQDYDVDVIEKQPHSRYRFISDEAKLDCFKTIFLNSNGLVPDEKTFLSDIKELGWDKKSVYLTEKVVNRKDSDDWSVLEKETDIELKYGIYSFKKKG